MARILVVDDVEENVELLKLTLERFGHETLCAYSGQAALDIAEKEDIDLVLLDVMMPGMDGVEAASRLKNSGRTRHVPIIFLTALRMEAEEVARALSAGADEYLTKPVNEVELIARVNSMLRMKSLYDQVAGAKKEMEEELQTAQAVQSSFLPTKFPYPERIRFFSRYRATASIGGDYYDVIDYGGGRVGMIMADVSGHGPSAALIVSMIKTILHAHDGGDTSPLGVVKNLNSRLLKMIPEERFVTLFFGVIDFTEWSLTYVRAGHPFPLLLRSGSNEIIRLQADGDFVGLFEEIEVEQEMTPINPGDRILMYSDGLIEVSSRENRLYGVGRLEKAVRARLGQDGNRLIEGIAADADSFNVEGAPTDDVAILLAEILRP